MSRMKRGWALTKKSWALLNGHRELIRFPLYGAVATTLLGIVILGPGLYLLDQDTLAGAIPLLVIGVYVLSVVGFYFSVGLAAAANMIFNGQEASVSRRPRRRPQPLLPDLRLGGALDRDQRSDGPAREPGRDLRPDRRPPGRDGLVAGHLPGGAGDRDRGHRPGGDAEALRPRSSASAGASRSPATSRSAPRSSCSAYCRPRLLIVDRRRALVLGLLPRRPAGRDRRPGTGDRPADLAGAERHLRRRPLPLRDSRAKRSAASPRRSWSRRSRSRAAAAELPAGGDARHRLIRGCRARGTRPDQALPAGRRRSRTSPSRSSAGRVTGFLGPNGAGKTTTMRALLGLLRPSSGEALVEGSPPAAMSDPLRTIGAALEATAFHPGRSGRNHLRTLAAAAGIGEARVGAVLEMVELSGAAERRVKGYSLGMRQRLALAAALLGEPRILILDEPANGLDPQGMRWLRDLLRAQAAEGRTVLISSHLLSEVAQTADELVMIRDGKLVAQTSLAEFTAGAAVPDPGAGGRGSSSWRRTCARSGRRSSSTAPRRCWSAGSTARGSANWRWRRGIALHELAPQKSSLEDRFFELMGDGGGGRVMLLRSEWIKLWSTRTTWVMLGIGLLGRGRSSPGSSPASRTLEDVGEIDQVATGTGLLLVLVLVLGVLIDHHRVPPRHRQLDLPRLAPALPGAGGEVRGDAARSASSPGSLFTLVNGGPGAAAAEQPRATDCRTTSDIVSIYAGVSRLDGADLRLRLRGRRDRPQPGRGDDRRDRLLLHPRAAAGTAAGRSRQLLPAAGDRRAAGQPGRPRRRPRPRSAAGWCWPPGSSAWS